MTLVFSKFRIDCVFCDGNSNLILKNTELVVSHLHIKTQQIIPKMNYISNILIGYSIKESFVNL